MQVSSPAALMTATVAGAFGSGLTTPLDVIKTRMQSAGANPADGFLATARKIVAAEGQGALWKARRADGTPPPIAMRSMGRRAVGWWPSCGARAVRRGWRRGC